MNMLAPLLDRSEAALVLCSVGTEGMIQRPLCSYGVFGFFLLSSARRRILMKSWTTSWTFMGMTDVPFQ